MTNAVAAIILLFQQRIVLILFKIIVIFLGKITSNNVRSNSGKHLFVEH